MIDVSIIGAGVVGTAIARELSKYDLSLCLIEKEEDVAAGASKANSGIVHGGYAAKAGTLKGELCIKGNRMYSQLDEELNFGFRRTGGLVIAFDEEEEKVLHELYENGLKLGCDDLEILHGDRIREIEPHINPEIRTALYCPSVGVTSPYEFTIALAENAVENGMDLKLETELLSIEKKEDHFILYTGMGNIESRYVINAAGLFSDKVAQMIGDVQFRILPRRGQYILLSKDQGRLANTVIFQVPGAKGKGILVTTTYHRNLMIGPNAEEVDDKDDVATTMESLEHVIGTARRSIPNFDIRRAITTFSGVRAVSNTGDFIIEESNAKGFIHAAGIDSPGLTSAPAIAERVLELLESSGLELKRKKHFQPYRKPIIAHKEKDFEGSIHHAQPDKRIICRCERVTEAEVIDAIHRRIPVKSTDAIKRRTRAGMGPCQGSFCRPRVRQIIAREMGIPVEEVTVRGKNAAPQPERVDIRLVRKCSQ